MALKRLKIAHHIGHNVHVVPWQRGGKSLNSLSNGPGFESRYWHRERGKCENIIFLKTVASIEAIERT